MLIIIIIVIIINTYYDNVIRENDMGRTEHVALTRDDKSMQNFSWKVGRAHLGDLLVVGWIILKLVIRKQDVMV